MLSDRRSAWSTARLTATFTSSSVMAVARSCLLSMISSMRTCTAMRLRAGGRARAGAREVRARAQGTGAQEVRARALGARTPPYEAARLQGRGGAPATAAAATAARSAHAQLEMNTQIS